MADTWVIIECKGNSVIQRNRV